MKHDGISKEQALRDIGGKLEELFQLYEVSPEEGLMILLGAVYGKADELGLTPRELFQRAAHVWDGKLVRRETRIHFPGAQG